MTPNAKTIKDILDGRNIYEIPEYQREYSWGNTEQDDFLTDILSNLDNGYFFGTMIIVKSGKKGPNSIFSLIDGQQRLTTIVLVLQAIRKLLIEQRRKFDTEALTETDYDSLLIKESRDAISGKREIYPVISSERLNPLFPAKILEIGVFIDNVEYTTFEQKRTFNSFERFKEKLSPENILSTIQVAERNNTVKEFIDSKNTDTKKYIKFLTSIADQLLERSSMVVIESTDKQFAQKIFRNLNSRGIPLNSIDLIKNDLLDVLNYEGSSGVVEKKWANILDNTTGDLHNDKKVKRTTEEFFSRYWNLKTNMARNAPYNKRMYNHFEKTIPVTSKDYKAILTDFEDSSIQYKNFFEVNSASKIFETENYFTRNDHSETLKYIEFLRNYAQERTLVLALFISRNRNILNDKGFKTFLQLTARFRMLWQVGGGRPNRINFLDKFARKIHAAKTQADIDNVLNNYKKELLSHLNGSDERNIAKEDFANKFNNLKYGHEYKETDLIVKHLLVIYEISLRDSHTQNNEFKNIFNLQIEHVIPYSKEMTQMSNLSLISATDEHKIDDLEKGKKRNGKKVPLESNDKKGIYAQSNVVSLNKLSEIKNLSENYLQKRGKEMSNKIFDFVLQTYSN